MGRSGVVEIIILFVGVGIVIGLTKGLTKALENSARRRADERHRLKLEKRANKAGR